MFFFNFRSSAAAKLWSEQDEDELRRLFMEHQQNQIEEGKFWWPLQRSLLWNAVSLFYESIAIIPVNPIRNISYLMKKALSKVIRIVSDLQ